MSTTENPVQAYLRRRDEKMSAMASQLAQLISEVADLKQRIADWEGVFQEPCDVKPTPQPVAEVVTGWARGLRS